jgi:hypothetical protein
MPTQVGDAQAKARGQPAKVARVDNLGVNRIAQS